VNIKSFIQRHSIATYFVLAYGISWSCILVVAALKGFRPDAIELQDGILMFLAMLVGPSLAGITMTAVLEGRSGLRSLVSRMGRWRVDLRWYAVLLVFPVLILTTLLTLTALVSPVFAPHFTAVGMVVGLLAGLFEEIGWTGFALPKLQVKYSALAAALLLGVPWGLWHILADYFGNISTMAVFWFPTFLGFMAAMTASRVLITWVYNNTGSLLLAQLMHVSSTGFLAVLGPSPSAPIAPAYNALWYAVYALVVAVVAAIVAVTYGQHLVHRRLHVQTA
jgi:membrane protease YdiL (CAAX protease family)